MTPTSVLSRPKILASIDFAVIDLNLARERYLASRKAASLDVETALVYAISAAQALAKAIEDLKKLAPDTEAARG